MPPQPRCITCGLPLTATVHCGRCVLEPPPFARTVCAVDYAFPWDRLIGRLKYDDRPEGAVLLADLLVRRVLELAQPMPSIVVPVPLSPQRLAERGYDQAWELARRVARRLALPAEAGLLRRRFDGRHQVGLSRSQRLANLRGAFDLPPRGRGRIVDAHVALVDDVMTTGATAAAAAQTLLAAGARRVDLWVVARTPMPGTGD